MRRRVRIRLAVALVLVAAPSVMAAEVVHFTNGTFMAVESHRIEGAMIHVQLGPDSTLAFPADRVEKIEYAGNVVYSSSPDGPAANQLVPGTSSRIRPVTGAVLPDRNRVKEGMRGPRPKPGQDPVVYRGGSAGSDGTEDDSAYGEGGGGSNARAPSSPRQKRVGLVNQLKGTATIDKEAFSPLRRARLAPAFDKEAGSGDKEAESGEDSGQEDDPEN